jgi:hypothetical protein
VGMGKPPTRARMDPETRLTSRDGKRDIGLSLRQDEPDRPTRAHCPRRLLQY